MRLKKLKKKNINVNLQWENVTEVSERLKANQRFDARSSTASYFPRKKLAKVKKFKRILKPHLIVILMYMSLEQCRVGNQPLSMLC